MIKCPWGAQGGRAKRRLGAAYLVQHVQGDRVEEVLHDDSQNGALSDGAHQAAGVRRDGHAGDPAAAVQSVDGLQSSLGALKGEGTPDALLSMPAI